MNLLTRVPAVLFVLAVPVLLIAGSVAWEVNDPGLYDSGFDKYSISLRTGISDADLRLVGAELRNYFNSDNKPLVVRTQVYGEEREIFNQREVAHMRDVKGLIRGVYLVALLAAAYLAAMVAVGFVRHGREFWLMLARLTLGGGGLTVALVLAVGVFALVGFDSLFLKFHQISFSNDLWQLDPRTDYLLIMFPQGFWLDATVRVATTAVVGGAILAGPSGIYLLIRWWRDPNRIYWKTVQEEDVTTLGLQADRLNDSWSEDHPKV